MSADIGVFNQLDLDDRTLLPEGWYIGSFRGERVEDATGPYKTEPEALAGMVARPIGHWLLPQSLLPAGIHRYTLDTARLP